jgi:hypothetical protein
MTARLVNLNWRFPFAIYFFAWLLLPLILFCLSEPRRPKQPVRAVSDRAPAEIATPSTPVALLVLVYGIAVLTQIIFYLIPVQLPFYLRDPIQADPGQSGMAIAFCTLFSAFASMSYGKIKAKLSFISIVPLT